MSGRRIKNIRVKDTRPGFKGSYRYKHFCASCGKGPFFTDFPIYQSRNAFCSKGCEDALYPRWLRWGLAAVILSVWALGLLKVFGVQL
jgi:hypothetical protein